MTMRFCPYEIVIQPQRGCHLGEMMLVRRRRTRCPLPTDSLSAAGGPSEDYPDCLRERSKDTVCSVQTDKDSIEFILLSQNQETSVDGQLVRKLQCDEVFVAVIEQNYCINRTLNYKKRCTFATET